MRVNAVAPGLIKTRFAEALWGNEAILDRVLASNPMGRIGLPEEVAAAVVFLASDAAATSTARSWSSTAAGATSARVKLLARPTSRVAARPPGLPAARLGSERGRGRESHFRRPARSRRSLGRRPGRRRVDEVFQLLLVLVAFCPARSAGHGAAGRSPRTRSACRAPHGIQARERPWPSTRSVPSAAGRAAGARGTQRRPCGCANAASSRPSGGSSGACSLPASSSSFDSGSAPGAAMLYAPAGPRFVASVIASTQSSRWIS